MRSCFDAISKNFHNLLLKSMVRTSRERRSGAQGRNSNMIPTTIPIEQQHRGILVTSSLPHRGDLAREAYRKVFATATIGISVLTARGPLHAALTPLCFVVRPGRRVTLIGGLSVHTSKRAQSACISICKLSYSFSLIPIRELEFIRRGRAEPR